MVYIQGGEVSCFPRHPYIHIEDENEEIKIL